MKLAIALVVAACGVFAQSSAAQSKGYSAPRLVDGKPDLNGIWQVQGKVDADLEGKIGGKNIIVDPPTGKIPYKPEALAKKKENNQTRATADTMTKCWMPGVPRLTYI